MVVWALIAVDHLNCLRMVATSRPNAAMNWALATVPSLVPATRPSSRSVVSMRLRVGREHDGLRKTAATNAAFQSGNVQSPQSLFVVQPTSTAARPPEPERDVRGTSCPATRSA